MRRNIFKGLCNCVVDMIVKMKPRGQEYSKISNTREMGKMSKTQFISEGDIVSFTSKGNKCNFVYTEIRACHCPGNT
jgi:hypothetical protein